MPRLVRISLVLAGLALAILAWRVLAPPPPADSDAARERSPEAILLSDSTPDPGKESPEEKRASLIVRGRVVGPDGRPFPEAAVAIWFINARGSHAVSGRGVTGVDGAFSMGSPSVALVRVTASAPGLVTALGGWFDSAGHPEVDVGTLRLRRGLAIAGRVVDLGGSPVAGDVGLECEADPVPEWWEPLRFASEGWFAAKTGANGEFRFVGVPPGRYRIAVEIEIGDDWATFNREHVEAGTEDLLVVVPEAATPASTERIRIRFRVLDPDGRPVPRGSYFVATGGSWMSGSFRDGTEDETMEGAFPAWLLVFNTWDGKNESFPYLPVRVRLTEATDEPIEVRLQPGLEIRGRTLVDGEPAAAALEVTIPLPGDAVLEENARSVHFDVRSGPDGRFAIPGLPPGTITLTPWHGSPLVPMPPMTATVGDQDVTVRLRRARDLKIVVKVPEGLQSARISAVLFETTAGGRRWCLMWPSGTEPKGSWSLDANKLDPRKRYELVVVTTGENVGYAPTHVRDLIPGGPTVEITLVEGLSITGTVTRRDGSPVAGASVRAIRPDAAGARTRAYLPDTNHAQTSSPVPDPSTTTDGSGRFRLGGLGEERVLLVATAPGLGGLAEPVPARARESGVVLVLESARTISGRIVDETGASPGDLTVEAWPESGPPELVVLGDVHHDGFFETGWLAAGRYRLIARDRWGDGDRIGVLDSVPAGARDVSIAVRKGVRISGFIRDPDGKAVAGARVDLRGPSAVRNAFTGDDGSFSFRALPPDRYRIHASVIGPPALVVARVVTGGEAIELVLGTD